MSFFYLLCLKTKDLIKSGDLGNESVAASHVAIKKRVHPSLEKSVGCGFIAPSHTHTGSVGYRFVAPCAHMGPIGCRFVAPSHAREGRGGINFKKQITLMQS
jgi:hypothetical protein